MRIMFTSRITAALALVVVAALALVIGWWLSPARGWSSLTDTERAHVMDVHGDRDGVGGEFQTVESGALVPETSPRWVCETMGNLTCGE